MNHDNKPRWSKNCPKCGREQIYSSKYTLQNAFLENKWCNPCRAESRKTTTPNGGWVKKCPSCGETQIYSCKSALTTSIKKNSICNSCRGFTKKIIPSNGVWKRACRLCGGNMVYSCRRSFNTGKRTDAICRKCSTVITAKYTDKSYRQTIEYKMKMSNALKSARNTDKYGEEFRRKCRENKQKQIQQQGTQRTYSPSACSFMDQFNLKFGTKLQHGMNGGECQFIGYSLDGYDKEQNAIFEYDEPKHNILSVRQKDEERQRRLIDYLHPSHFWRYNEKHNKLIDVVGNTEVLWQT